MGLFTGISCITFIEIFYWLGQFLFSAIFTFEGAKDYGKSIRVGSKEVIEEKEKASKVEMKYAAQPITRGNSQEPYTYNNTGQQIRDSGF